MENKQPTVQEIINSILKREYEKMLQAQREKQEKEKEVKNNG